MKVPTSQMNLHTKDQPTLFKKVIQCSFLKVSCFKKIMKFLIIIVVFSDMVPKKITFKEYQEILKEKENGDLF